MKATPGSERGAAEIVAALRNAKHADEAALETELLAHGAEAVKPLIELIADHKGQDRSMVMIANLGDKAPPALVALLPNDALRVSAAKALAHAAGSRSAGQAQELVDCMSRWPDAKHYCGMALGRGMNSKQARWIPLLARTLKSDDRDQRVYAAVALKQIGTKTPGVREALLTVVADSDEEVRRIVSSAGVKAPPKPAAAKTKGAKAK